MSTSKPSTSSPDAQGAPEGVPVQSKASTLDESAAFVFMCRPVRVAVTIGVALLCLFMLPWPECAVWLGAALVLEIWGEFCTRGQYRKRPVSNRTRKSFTAFFATLHVNWALLILLLWMTGTLGGRCSAIALVICLATIGLLLAYQTPVAFVAAGAAPPIAAVTMITASCSSGPAAGDPDGSPYRCDLGADYNLLKSNAALPVDRRGNLLRLWRDRGRRPDLNDLDYGTWQWRTHEEVEADDPARLARWRSAPHLVRFLVARRCKTL